MRESPCYHTKHDILYMMHKPKDENLGITLLAFYFEIWYNKQCKKRLSESWGFALKHPPVRQYKEEINYGKPFSQTHL